jgi:hypothetical protein
MVAETSKPDWRLSLQPRGRYSSLFLSWREDRIEVASGRLVVTRLFGPFHTARRFERDAVRRILLAGRDDRLALETARGRVELSRLGTRAERFMGAAALRHALGIPESPAGAIPIPSGWEEIVTPEGQRALVVNHAQRRMQSVVAGVGAVLMADVTRQVARGWTHERDAAGAAILLLACAAGLAAWAAWLALGRSEWCIGRGRLTLRRRFASAARDVFEARRLALVMTTDSDGDQWYELVALTDEGSPLPSGIELTTHFAGSPPRPAGIAFRTSGSTRRTVARRMNDGSRVRDLGAWLAHATGLEFQDHTAPFTVDVRFARLRA